MKALLRLLVFAFLWTVWFPPPSRADPPTVSACDAWKHVGQNVAVEGIVTVVSTTKKGVTLIYLGGYYPNQCLTAWVPAGTDLARDNLKSLRGKKIRVRGTIQLSLPKPDIKVLSRDQITEESSGGPL
jgi:hypothetical protein